MPYTVAMVVLDILAPILLMIGIGKTNSANASLLNNFEIVATSVIALLVFKEMISRKLWIAIDLVTIASVILSFEGQGAFVFNDGSWFVLGACVCWGFENNCTKMISNKSSEEIVIIKGCFSGLGSLFVAIMLGESVPPFEWMTAVLVLGLISYGLSINFYLMAQKDLGAAKTSAYYSVAPCKYFTIICNEPQPICDYIHDKLGRSATRFYSLGNFVLQLYIIELAPEEFFEKNVRKILQ